MHPANISKMYATVYGGEASGMSVIVHPTSLNEVMTFFMEAKEFLSSADSRMVEFTLIDKAGETDIKRIYAKVKTKPVNNDPFERNFNR